MILQLQFKLLVMMLLPGLLLAENPSVDKTLKTTREKSIQKSFNVNSDATLKVDNSYGNVDIVTWDRNTVDFDITIKVTGSNEDKVNDRLNDIDVQFSNSSSMVSAETKFGKKKNGSWWNWGKSNLKIEVNYVVKIPKTNNINIRNDYGAINVDELMGRAQISCDYGKITTKELMADNNSLYFDYSNGCYFEYIKSGNINADYSSYTVAKANQLDINADYTKSAIEAVEDVTYNCDYGSLKVDNINNLEGNGDYLTLRLGNVYKNVSIKADYGSIKIDKMAAGAGNIDIQTDYAGMTIGHDANYNFKFEVELEYASMRNSDDFEFVKSRIESSEKYYLGYYGDQNSPNKVSIKSEYGSVNFKKL
ncbi:hypothetical protein [Winogradskyella aurantiaca]|uniref:hypothetical protein n=1 Tax=Winogradskyella aurantiaca TaxID=2219558 RepID=UPI000E1C5064|nr:hypothetical protein [Winogradskyella aurantiaca]